MFQCSCRFAFLSTFRLSNQTPKIRPILTLHQANATTLAPFNEEDKLLIKSLYEYKGYNARQFMAEFPDKCLTKNCINRLLVKLRNGSMLTGSVTRNFRHIR